MFEIGVHFLLELGHAGLNNWRVTLSNQLEFVEGDLEAAGDAWSFTTLIDHFSSMVAFEGVGSSSLDRTPDPVMEGQVQQAKFNLRLGDRVELVLGNYGCGGTCHVADFRTYEFALGPIAAKRVQIYWDAPSDSSNWRPNQANPEPIDVSGGWEAFAESTCLRPNSWFYGAHAIVTYSLTFLSRSEGPSLDHYNDFGDPVFAVPDSVPEKHEVANDDWHHPSIEPGDTFKAYSSILIRSPAICVGADSTTTTEPPTGSDEVGDQEDGNTSEQVAAGEGVPAGDITNARYVPGDSGEQCFIVDVNGDGETVATGAAGWYDVIISVIGPDGEEWRANVAYFDPIPTDRGVYVGPLEPGQQRVEGAEVAIEWDDSDTFRVCVDGGETILDVESFIVSVGVSTAEGTFWDYANGVA